MLRAFLTWLQIGFVLELLAVGGLAVLAALGIMAAAAAHDAAVKITVALIVLTLSGGVISALLGRRSSDDSSRDLP